MAPIIAFSVVPGTFYMLPLSCYSIAFFILHCGSVLVFFIFPGSFFVLFLADQFEQLNTFLRIGMLFA